MKTLFKINKTVLLASLLLIASGIKAQSITYLWSNGATTPNIVVNPQETTTYYVTITQGDFQYFDSVVVEIGPPPAIVINVNINIGDSYFFGEQFLTESGVYSDSLINSAGCDSIVILNLSVLEQAPSVVTFQKTFGGSEFEMGSDVLENSHGDFIVCGSTTSYGAGVGDVYLLSLSSSGQEVNWTRTFGGLYDDNGYSLKEEDSGDLILSGIQATSESWYDAYFLSVDTLGFEKWSKSFGGIYNDYGRFIEVTSDGGYVIAGIYADSSTDGGYNQMFLAKISSSDSLIWSYSYGNGYSEVSCEVIKTFDGGFLMAGYTDVYGFGGTNMYLVKTDSNGIIQWTKSYGGIGNNDLALSVTQLDDGGFAFSGITDSYGAGELDVYVLRINQFGDPLWSKTFGGAEDDLGGCIRKTDDGNLIIVGSTRSFGFGGSDVYLLKLTLEGDLIWSKTFGGELNENIYLMSGTVEQTADGGYIIVGETNSFGSGGYDIYVIKTDANGNSFCNESNPPTQIGSGTITGSGGTQRTAGELKVPNTITNSGYLENPICYQLPCSITNFVIDTTINACQSYNFIGVDIFTSGTYSDTLQNSAGCDSVVTLNLTITPQPEQPQIACWQTANFNTTTCSWDVSGTQPQQPTNLACWQSTNFNTTSCSWDVIGTQPTQPTNLTCWQTANFNTTTCSWDVSGTQPTQPTNLACWQTANFNTITCSWDVIGTQPAQPTGLACWQSANFNTATCSWVVTGTQPAEPSNLACWQAANFNTTTCSWDVTGTQPAQPTNLACWQTANFNTTTCAWDVTGTQPTVPTNLACWQSANFSTTTCSWDVSGTQPAQPTGLACWQSANFNTTTCSWDVSGTQPAQPTGLACWQSANFNTSICSWNVTGTQPAEPTNLACWQTANFNTTTCSWDVSGTQPAQPTYLDCWQTATFNTTTCSWDVTGTQPVQPTGLACYETATFNGQTCSWEISGTPAPPIVTNASACVNYTWAANGETYSISGQYSFNSNCQDYTLNLSINQAPTVTYEPDLTTFCNNSGSVELSGGTPAGGTYSGPGVENGIFSPAAAGEGLHSIVYSVTNANGCSNESSALFEVALCTGVSDNTNSFASVYPNPIHDVVFVHINSTSSRKPLTLLVSDATGRAVIQKTIHAAHGNFTVDVAHLSHGMYTFTLSNDEQFFVKRLVK